MSTVGGNGRLMRLGTEDRSERMRRVARLVEMHFQPTFPFSSHFAIIYQHGGGLVVQPPDVQGQDRSCFGIDHV